jgi:hypothetical protein
MDLGERGSLQRRKGMVRYRSATLTGKGQGYFRYYRSANDYDDVMAINGKIEVNGIQKTITGLTGGFQTTKPIEAVQFQNKLFIATGTKLVEYDGTSLKVVTPYAPQPLEALYIGTNGLADNPDNFMQDGVAISKRIDGVTFSSRYGIVNQPVTLTAYISVPSGTSIQYLFEYRYPYMEAGVWTLGKDWSSSKTYAFQTGNEGDVQFRVSIRQTGQTLADSEFLVPKYKIKPTNDPKDVPISTTNIHKCNRIVLHWNRLVLYGDDTQGDAIYLSHLNNPYYFPVPNSLRFENGRSESLTKIVQFRDMLVAFTPTSIQALFGKSPLDFKRVTLHTGLGCIAPDSAVVMKNYIAFLSNEGIHILKSVGYAEDKANIQKIDNLIDNLVPKHLDACGIIQDNQYHIVFPQSKIRLRFYLERGVWTKDESTKLDFSRMYSFDGKLYGQSSVLGHVLEFREDIWNDDGVVYADSFETKAFNFGQPYHSKKVKELQMLLSPKEGTINATLFVYGDSAALVSPDKSYASVVNGEVVWNMAYEPNIHAHTGSNLGDWKMGNNPFGTVELDVEKLRLSGKCRNVKVTFLHEEATPSKILGLGFIFKTKSP